MEQKLFMKDVIFLFLNCFALIQVLFKSGFNIVILFQTNL
jgi:hypothetical protein